MKFNLSWRQFVAMLWLRGVFDFKHPVVALISNHKIRKTPANGMTGCDAGTNGAQSGNDFGLVAVRCGVILHPCTTA
jgi:hypothetical protein